LPRRGSRPKKKTRRRASRKVELDETSASILKVMEKAKRSMRCSEIAGELGVTTQKVAARMRRLSREGLVKRNPDGSYEITRAGKRAV